MTRHEARTEAFSLIFESEYHKDKSCGEIYALAKEDRDFSDSKEYIKNTFENALSNLREIDEMIASSAKGWSVERMSGTTRSILRLCVSEMIFGDTPAKVALNEAVEIAKEYGDDETPAFVNGILNNIAREKGLIVSDENE